jgi:Protein kinase domain
MHDVQASSQYTCTVDATTSHYRQCVCGVHSAACCCSALTLSMNPCSQSRTMRTLLLRTHATHYVQSLPNGTLSQLVKNKGGSLPYWQVKYLAACMVLAVEDLHRGGITHNDIKPDNVLLDAQVLPLLSLTLSLVTAMTQQCV